MEEDNLDSFLNNKEASAPNAPAPALSTGQDGAMMQRPKLRKIKRPKIRPASDMPQAMPKVSPVIDGQSSNSAEGAFANSINNTSLQQNGSVSAQTAETSDSFGQDGAALPDGAETTDLPGTNIISAVEAQNLTAGQEYNNPYVLDGLPPELDYITDDDAGDFGESTGYVKKNVLYIAACACLFVGLFVGKALFSSQTVENHGLEGVVTNPDVPAGRPRCGLTDKSQACILYIMNCYKQELNGRNFYKLAAQLTGREEYMIDTDNLRYATVKIKPGHFAQLNIPALK